MTQTFATTTLSGLLVTPDWLAARLNAPALRILDVRLAESFADGHVPGAQHLDLNRLRAEKDGVEGMLIDAAPFAEIMGQFGIDARTTVVLYDDHHGMPAARAAWSLLRYGHPHVALLDGGWDAWETQGLPVTSEISGVEPRRFEVCEDAAHEADFEWVRTHIQSPGVVLLDVRSQTEFDKGRLPGALLWDWENGADDAHTFRDAEETRAALAQAGVTPDQEIVTYCQSGVRAAHTFFLLRHLGFERVRMYDGSWAEWSQRA